MLIKRDLNKAAEKYVLDVLSYDNVLCRCAQEALGLRKGRIATYVFMPDDRNAGVIEDFSEGGVYTKAASYLPRYLLDKYGKEKGVLFVFDDVMADPADDCLAGEGLDVKSIRDEVYHIYNGHAVDEEILEKTIWATAVAWHFVCVVLTMDAPSLNKEITETSLCEGIKANLMEVVVGAFDGEGFIHNAVMEPGINRVRPD